MYRTWNADQREENENDGNREEKECTYTLHLK